MAPGLKNLLASSVTVRVGDETPVLKCLSAETVAAPYTAELTRQVIPVA